MSIRSDGNPPNFSTTVVAMTRSRTCRVPRAETAWSTVSIFWEYPKYALLTIRRSRMVIPASSEMTRAMSVVVELGSLTASFTR
jgi:hypothetical protein